MLRVKNDNSKLHYFSAYKRIAFVGPMPPPLGGVSVYIYRLSKLVSGSSVLPFIGGGFKSYIWLFIKLLLIKADMIHVNVLNVKCAMLLLLLSKIRRWDIVTVDHNDQLFVARNKLEKIILKKLLERAKYVIAVGKHIFDRYKENNVDISNERFLVQDSFIPPPLNEEKAIISTYPAEYFGFVDSHEPVVITSAFKLIKENGIDLYGIDMVINMMSALRLEGKQSAGLVIFLAEADSSYLNELYAQIEKLGLVESVLFVIGQKELWPAYLRADLSVRATLRDGFGVSVAESIALSCPAVASNVCERAEGAILFEARDQTMLNSKALRVLNDQQQCD